MALVTVQRSPTPSATSSPSVSEADSGEEERRCQPRSISESFLTVKGAALFLPRGNGSTTPRISQRRNKHAGDLQQHLQAMFLLLRPEDNIRLAVRLESAYQSCTRYMVVVSTNGRQDTEESIVLGMDFKNKESSCCTMGLVLPLWSDTLIHLDGDGGFSVSTVNRVHIFKPVSVQAMWSALQSLHKACEVARCHNYYPGSLFLTWTSYYESHISSDQVCINEWNAMQDVQSHRADSPVLFTDVPTERERTERLIKTKLREIMMQKDLENITSKEIRTELEMQMVCNLREFKEFIDNEMIVILGQMDSPTEIFDHVFLGSEWNASNLEDLQNRGVRYILNVTREIDNFFPGLFEYHNIRVYDEEATDLLAYWNDAYKFISKAKKTGSKCLVHCKMGVSRSASTVIAYAMKEYGWNLEHAYSYVKERRTVTKPNPSFMRQLEEYQGILLASKQRHNKLWRSHSDSDLSDHHDPINKTPLNMNLNQKDADNNPSLEHFLGMAVLQALTTMPSSIDEDPPTPCEDHDSLQLDFQPCTNEESLEQSASNGLSDCPDSPETTTVVLPCVGDMPLQEVSSIMPTSLVDLGGDKPLLEPKLNTQEKNTIPTGQSSPSLSLTANARISDVDVYLDLKTEFLEDTGGQHNSNNNPRSPSHTVQSPSLSTDSIDFFSAREKFLELSQEGRARALSQSRNEDLVTPKLLQPRSPGQDLLDTEDSAHPVDEHTKEQCLDITVGVPRSQSENGISVKDIVIELESINQSCGPSPCKTDSSTTISSPATMKKAVVHSLQSEPPGDLEPTSICESPSDDLRDSSTCHCETSQDSLTPKLETQKWLSGSVRRATNKLEQRLRQEQEPGNCLGIRKNSRHDEVPSIEVHPQECGDNQLHNPLLEEGTMLPLQKLPKTGDISVSSDKEEACSCHSDSAEKFWKPLESKPKEKEAPITSTVKAPFLSCRVEITELASNHSPLETEGSCPMFPLSEREYQSSSDHSNHVYVSDKGRKDPSSDLCEFISQEPGMGTKQTVDDDLCYISHLQNPPLLTRSLSPKTCLLLEGATESSSDTDILPDRPTESSTLQRSTEELLKIQETLSDLQAFLNRVTPTVSRPPNWASLPHSSSSSSVSELTVVTKGHSGMVKQRAQEIEARIRQAGLTTPSLMKRSASLAKLGCLELSTDDLSEVGKAESGLASPACSFRLVHPESCRAHLMAEDPSKKFCMASESTLPGEQSCRSDCGSLSQPVELPSILHTSTFRESNEGCLESCPSLVQATEQTVPFSGVAPRQQYGRTHPLRKLRKANEKKRTASFQYNTM
ncbi:protein phosphatase Slingshot homolog 2-like isoform X2 [Erpetoichthys calabaricus]|uniref:protein-serine/threonine phosphatase n=1 Tax=Erpetoichthys calabaricus TaxID=27687 RepID=A0A8C4S9L2_ERPCA|nr:protein phosphatase Slingshot homolog 2-like isoform X2 [Erpetoichthys calabaricus]